MDGPPPAPPIGAAPKSSAIGPTRHADRARTEDLPLIDRIAVLEHVLSMLDTLTVAGQRHMMKRIVTFIRQQIVGTVSRFDDRDTAELLGLVIELDRKSAMALPEVGPFTSRAKKAFARLLARESDKEAGDRT